MFELFRPKHDSRHSANQNNSYHSFPKSFTKKKAGGVNKNTKAMPANKQASLSY